MTVAHIHTIKMTADQYFQLGEDPPGVHLELIDGEIIVSPSAYPRHSQAVSELHAMLLNYIKPLKLGKLFLDTDVPFERHTVRRPDICFYATPNLHRVSPTRLSPPPDLCIEVLSPGNIDDDRINKFNLYQSHGVPHYWIIDPEARTAEAYALQAGKYSLTAIAKSTETPHFPPFADLALPLAELWMP
ncbi:MAG TPA: Uma2 family endonuclease [Phycisphaerae bacterium]|nr:Uma2 family endonuclease [Phycisphaerae bacterium]